MRADIEPAISRFRIDVAESTLHDLEHRLRRTRFAESPPDAGWRYGANAEYMRALIAYWLDGYDWRAQERYLNAFPQYVTQIDDYLVHFVHVRGRGESRLPLVLTHGWPSSFTEMLRILPLLTDPRAHGESSGDAFDVVVPSVPGYGFSTTTMGPGQPPAHDLWVRLMERLGYHTFVAAGGDIGAGITTRLARFHPERVRGILLQSVVHPCLHEGSPPLSAAEMRYLEDLRRWQETEGAYAALQSTKPQTPAYALNDSPAGLAAWIIEKFRTWSDCEGDVERCFSKDELLTNVMIYWVTQSIASSMRYYHETANHAPQMKPGERIAPPTAAAIFPRDLMQPPREWVERSYNVQRYREMPRGGHFAAHEQPELLAHELREFFRPLRT